MRPQVSLWLGEQFAADLSMAFKKLSVKCISSNKVLGLLGQVRAPSRRRAVGPSRRRAVAPSRAKHFVCVCVVRVIPASGARAVVGDGRPTARPERKK